MYVKGKEKTNLDKSKNNNNNKEKNKTHTKKKNTKQNKTKKKKKTSPVDLLDATFICYKTAADCTFYGLCWENTRINHSLCIYLFLVFSYHPRLVYYVKVIQ